MRTRRVVRSRCAAALIASAIAPAVCVSSAPAELSPVGDEVLVNEYTTGEQGHSVAVSATPAGDFIVVWGSRGLTPDVDVLARGLSRDGTPSSGELRVSDAHPGYDGGVDVGTDAAGNFVVVWTAYDQAYCDFSYPSGRDVVTRRLAADGSELDGEAVLPDEVCGTQGTSLAAASDDAGRFVVVWGGSRSSDCGRGCGYLPSEDGYGCESGCGVPWADAEGYGAWIDGGQKVANTTTTGNQADRSVDVAAVRSGGFIVVWNASSGQDGSGNGVFAQRFDQDETKVGTEFQVDAYTTGDQGESVAVAADTSGAFIVAWTSEGEDGDGQGVLARRYDSTGGALGTPFVVNTYTTGDQGMVGSAVGGRTGVSVAADAFGRFLVAWTGQDADETGVFARFYENDGTPAGPEFQVNSYTTSRQRVADIGRAVAAAAAGDFMVAWASLTQDGNGYGVVARAFTAGACPAKPRAGCASAAKSRIKLRDKQRDARDKIIWTWRGASGAPLGDLGDPATVTTYALCVYDEVAGVPALKATLAVAPSEAWTRDAERVSYQDSTATQSGVRRLLVTRGGAGRPKAGLKARGESLPLPSPATSTSLFAQDGEVIVQLLDTELACWEARFSDAAKNDVDRFLAKVR